MVPAPAFKSQMKRLIGLKFAPADLTTHWEALRDLPDDLLAEAVTLAARDCIDFPAPKQLREFADKVRAAIPTAFAAKSAWRTRVSAASDEVADAGDERAPRARS